MSNLVGNAVQHSTSADVDVVLEGDADAVVLSVHNDRPPIPETVLPQLFEQFHRGPSLGAESAPLVHVSVLPKTGVRVLLPTGTDS